MASSVDLVAQLKADAEAMELSEAETKAYIQSAMRDLRAAARGQPEESVAKQKELELRQRELEERMKERELKEKEIALQSEREEKERELKVAGGTLWFMWWKVPI